MGLALGGLRRRSEGGLSVFAAVFLVVPLVAAYLPQSINGFAPYLPSNAGGTIWGGREAVRRASARPVDRIRGPVRLRGRADRRSRLAPAQPRRLCTPKDDRKHVCPSDND